MIAYVAIWHEQKRKRLLQLQNSILNENKRQLILPEKQLMQLAAQQVQRDLEIINDAIELVNTTTKSGAFFHRLDLLLEHSRHIVRFESFVPFKGGHRLLPIIRSWIKKRKQLISLLTGVLVQRQKRLIP